MIKEPGTIDLCHIFGIKINHDRHAVKDQSMPRWAIPPLLEHFFDFQSQQEFGYRFYSLDFEYGLRERTLEKLSDCIEKCRESGESFVAYVHLKGETMPHAVAISFDSGTGCLTYQDPQGDAMPRFLDEFLSQPSLKNLDVKDLRIKQQHDEISCSYITLYNLVSMVRGHEISENIDTASLREAMHAIIADKIDNLQNGLSPQVMSARLWETSAHTKEI